MDTEQIDRFLSAWGKGVVEIGKIHREGGDYVKSAKTSSILTTLSKKLMSYLNQHLQEKQFLEMIKRGALSYFIGGDIPEDNGFALKPWEDIQLDELNTLTENDLTAAMGTLKFKPYKKEETTLVAFTFIFIKIGDYLKIKVHHSSPVT